MVLFDLQVDFNSSQFRRIIDKTHAIEDCSGSLQVDFANCYIGGGVLCGVFPRFYFPFFVFLLTERGMCARRNTICNLP